MVSRGKAAARKRGRNNTSAASKENRNNIQDALQLGSIIITHSEPYYLIPYTFVTLKVISEPQTGH